MITYTEIEVNALVLDEGLTDLIIEVGGELLREFMKVVRLELANSSAICHMQCNIEGRRRLPCVYGNM